MSAAPERLDPFGIDEDPHAFVLGGVAYRVHPAPDLRWRLEPAHRAERRPFGAGPIYAHVDCVVASAPELARQGAERCDWRGDEARLEGCGVRGELRRLATGRYAATLLVSPDAEGCSALVRALAAALAQRERS